MEVVTNNLKLIVMDNILEFGNRVDRHLKLMRGIHDPNFSFIIPVKMTRFSSGEGKATILETVREQDVYVFSDVTNYSCTYKMRGFTNHMSPDDHFQDIKRVISAMNKNASSVHLVMPFLYEGRQHKRKGRESMDCSLMLHELERMGTRSIITIDAHDPTIRNAIEDTSFDSVFPTYSILKEFIETEDLDFDKLFVVSPDTGAVDRAVFYANMLGTDVGIYHKRRDYSQVVDGKNPIVAHHYMGAPVEGKDVLIVDDMIASGQSILEVAEEMKERGASKVYLSASFALFSDGEKSVEAFNEAYEKGIFDRLYATNLNYVPEETKSLPWFHQADCSKYIAKIIDNLNNRQPISPLLDSKEKILVKINQAKTSKATI